MELIKNYKTRQSTFQRRKNSLKKKAFELSTLCDVKAGIIIYGPKSDDQPEIWPNNHGDIKELIDKYKNQPIDDKKRKRTADLSNFFEDRKKKSESVLSKLRKKNDEAQYPTWNNLYNDLSEEQLRDLARVFEAKLESVKARFEFLKGNNAMESLFRRSKEELEEAVHPQPLNQQAHYELDYLDSNLMETQMMMVMNNNDYSDCSQSGSASSYVPVDGGAFYYDPMIGMAEESMVVNNPALLMCYYGPAMPQPIQYTGLMVGPSSRMNDYCYDQVSEFV